jgi:hypothetical protein
MYINDFFTEGANILLFIKKPIHIQAFVSLINYKKKASNNWLFLYALTGIF